MSTLACLKVTLLQGSFKYLYFTVIIICTWLLSDFVDLPKHGCFKIDHLKLISFIIIKISFVCLSGATLLDLDPILQQLFVIQAFEFYYFMIYTNVCKLHNFNVKISLSMSYILWIFLHLPNSDNVAAALLNIFCESFIYNENIIIL